jgi:hypothetical protein
MHLHGTPGLSYKKLLFVENLDHVIKCILVKYPQLE